MRSQPACPPTPQAAETNSIASSVDQKQFFTRRDYIAAGCAVGFSPQGSRPRYLRANSHARGAGGAPASR